MTDEIEGWREVAAFVDATTDDYEEADYLANEVSSEDGIRAIDVGDDARLEVRTQHGTRWVPVATLNGNDPYEDPRPVYEHLKDIDGYRVVIVKHGGVYVEKRVDNK